VLVSQRKFAKIVGRSHAYINKLVRQGVIPVYDKKIKVDEAKEILEKMKDPARDPQREANERRRKHDLFEAAQGYESLADMSEEERKRYEEEQKAKEEERKKEIEETKKLIEDIEKAGIALSSDLKELAAQTTLNEAKTINEILRGKLQELEYKQRIGELVSKREVEREAYELAKRVRDAILSIPDRVAAVLAAQTDQRRIREILLEELHHALEILAQEGR